MSAFLGKIHYWLYNKIQLHEKLIESIANLAKRKGYDSEILLNESYLRYGSPITGALEDKIEHSNIHGWLQERIRSVESRLAYIVTELLRSNIVSKEELYEIFYENGVSTMKKLEIKGGSPQAFFTLIFDYMIEGMPCDRVHEVIKNNEMMIEWKITRDIHKDYWNEVDGNINDFYDLRDSWIRGFLNEASTEYRYIRTENGINTIKRV